MNPNSRNSPDCPKTGSLVKWTIHCLCVQVVNEWMNELVCICSLIHTAYRHIIIQTAESCRISHSFILLLTLKTLAEQREVPLGEQKKKAHWLQPSHFQGTFGSHGSAHFSELNSGDCFYTLVAHAKGRLKQEVKEKWRISPTLVCDLANV